MHDLRIGLFLGLRQIERANPWTTVLIVIVILFTFLNLVAVSGILSGIVDGAMRGVRTEAIGDITIDALDTETRILGTETLLRELQVFPGISSFSPRYQDIATIEANFKERRDLSIEPDIIAGNVTGIDPESEDRTTGLSSLIVEGSYFEPNEQGSILIGKYYIDRYAEKFGDVFDSLKDIYPGDIVRVTAHGRSEEFVVKGIIDSKIDIVSLRIYMTEKEFRRFFNRADHNANQISVRLAPGIDENVMRTQLIDAGLATHGKILTFSEGLPKFITDITRTFTILGAFIGGIGIIVASITIFIIIFINALSRRRQIGILKAIGISRRAIEYAYVTQAAFYAVVGSCIGFIMVFGFLIPYFETYPIDFPFSDGTLAATPEGAILRCAILFGITLIAGFLPAWLIAKQNTLNAILGRK